MFLKGQSIMEYLTLIAIVTMALVYMGTDMRRGIQSVVKVTADQMGKQANADQDFDQQTQRGILLNSMANTWQSQQQATVESRGFTTKIVNDRSGSSTSTLTNTGIADQ